MDAWDWIACPGRASWFDWTDGIVHKQALDLAHRAVVPHDGVLVADEIERRTLEAILSELRVGRTDPILVPASLRRAEQGRGTEHLQRWR